MLDRTRTLALCAALGLAGAALGPAAAQTADGPAAAAKPAAHPAKRAAKRRAAAPAPAPSAPSAAAGAYQLVPSGGSALTRARAGSFEAPEESPVPPGYRRKGQLGIGLGGANGTTPGMSLGF